MTETYDAVVVGGGPAGATAARDLAQRGRSVLLLDRAGRIKPCGGAIPPRLIQEFDIDESLLVARVTAARVVSPTAREADMPIEGGFVGMVDRDVFDEWLRERAQGAGAERRTGTFERIERDADGTAVVHYRGGAQGTQARSSGEPGTVRARVVIGADGAKSAIAQAEVPGADRTRHVFAYHEIVRSPEGGHAGFDGNRCDVHYRGSLSPDFYGWIFPHGATTSVGMGTAHKGFSMREAVGTLRETVGLDAAETIRREGAPIPLRPLPRWDNGRDVILAGDAAGAVAPASGEGIYYSMLSGRLAAEAVHEVCASGRTRALRTARKRFMAMHGQVFMVLNMMEKFWYANDNRRERFVSICRDPDVQKLTWDAYMSKRLVRARPAAHVRIFIKNLAHLSGMVSA
jgi:geranylgeranyl diphosphate/geranylgeranyl-bacteriochlorophyllide a reductase